MKKFAEVVLKYRIGIIILTVSGLMEYKIRNLVINSNVLKYQM